MILIHRLPLVVTVLLAACSLPQGDSNMAAKSEAPVVVLDNAGAKAHVGKLVSVKGVARDARISAAVVTESFIVYCLGLASWPGGISGKTIVVHGRLEYTDELAAKRRPGGEISAGTDGPVWVLRDCVSSTRLGLKQQPREMAAGELLSGRKRYAVFAETRVE